MKKLGFCFFVLAACTTLYAYAENSDSQPAQQQKPKGIPQEAITACTGKNAGDSCTVGEKGTGTCGYTPDKKYFACKPNDAGRGGPPPQGQPGSRDSSNKPPAPPSGSGE